MLRFSSSIRRPDLLNFRVGLLFTACSAFFLAAVQDTVTDTYLPLLLAVSALFGYVFMSIKLNVSLVASFNVARHKQALLVVVCLCLIQGVNSAEPITIVVIGKIITAVTTIVSLVGTVLTILKWVLCYTILFIIIIVIIRNVILFFQFAQSLSVTNYILKLLLQALGCEPIDPEYGFFRPNLYPGTTLPAQ